MPTADKRAQSRVLTAAILALTLVLSSLSPRLASAEQDPRQQRDEVRKKKAAAAADVDALRANDAEVRQALADLQANLAGQQGELDDARLVEAQANEAVRQARLRERAMQDQIVTIKSELREIAVQAYIDGGTTPRLADSGSMNLDDLVRQSYLKAEANRHIGLADQLRAAEEDLAAARKDAETNAALATQKRAEIQQRVGEVEAAKNQQSAFVADVETRLDERLSEAASLNALDQRLSSQIAAQEAAIAARVPKGGGPSRSSGPVANIPLTTVRGITVASSIADQLDRMLAAAEADGITYGGSGYRDSSAQWQLRQSNCPDPANSPPSACSPPTARAGASMHERGLAIDFTYGGRIIDSYDSPGYQWFAANAGRFGFSNLPSEPWHWSVNGQ